MTKDFKEGKPSISAPHGVSWMLGGIAVGLLIGVAIFGLISNPSQSSTTQTTQQTSSTTDEQTATTNVTTQPEVVVAQAQADVTSEKKSPMFSYHALLPQISMENSFQPTTARYNPDPRGTQQDLAIQQRLDAQQQAAADALARQQAAELQKQQQATLQPETVATDAQGVMIQLGSYRSQPQAVKMQERARSYGMNTRIEPAQVNGQLWYRVRIGPSADMNVVDRWQQSVSGMGIKPMVIRM